MISYTHLLLLVSLGSAISSILTWLWCRSSALRERGELNVHLAAVTAEKQGLAQKLQALEPLHEGLQTENRNLKIRMAQLEQMRISDGEKIQWIGQAQAQMRDAFAALSAQTLQKNSELFASRAREQVEALFRQAKGDWNTHKAQLENLFDPVRENLHLLESHVRELEQKREGAYQGLTDQLEHLSRAHAEIRTATISLTQALKSPTVRGRWGEIQLRRVVEMSGMIRHVIFEEQTGTDWGRPDMIIHLPNAGILPVDAKVPLQAYLEAAETDRPEEHRRKMEDHAKAMRSRIRELGRKKYWEQFENAPDFVVMFLPGDSCLSAAFDQDPEILEYAMNQRVLISTPVTLIALLKAVAYGWKQHQVTENALHIAQQGQELCRRLETFMAHFAELKTHLNKSVEGYNKTLGSLERRLLPIARRFQEMNLSNGEPAVPEEISIQARDISLL
ncbi:MAG: DNA recombination protein RmuC [Desulfobacterales bacterium]